MQSFSIFYKDIPGFNEILSAAKSVGLIKHNKMRNSYGTMKKLWERRLIESIKKNKIKKYESIKLRITWIENNRKRDPDNIAAFIKFILDALQKTGVIENDGWRQIKGWENSFELGASRGVNVLIMDANQE
jgi:Holliday junction resolvase RusA-like endonuclease